MATTSRGEETEFGFVYGRSGVSQGTTTSTGVITVNTLFARSVVYALAHDENSRFRRADVVALGGTTGTFLDFQPITHSGVTARFRVRRQSLTAGGSSSSFTLATSVSVQFRWLAFGY